MNEGLDRFRKGLERYTLLALLGLLASTGIFFYFYFIVPNKEARRLTSATLGDTSIQATILKKADQLGAAHESKKARPEISTETVRGLSGE